jgi:hypothetical protein
MTAHVYAAAGDSLELRILPEDGEVRIFGKADDDEPVAVIHASSEVVLTTDRCPDRRAHAYQPSLRERIRGRIRRYLRERLDGEDWGDL